MVVRCSSLLVWLVLLCGLIHAQWKPLRTGGGGWMTGMHLHRSGDVIYARSDVGSAYRWDEAKREWTNVVTAQAMPSTDVHWSRHSGVLSIVSAPSESNVAYLAYQDTIYRSDNRGDVWRRTSLPSMLMSPNDDQSKLSGERLGVDPENPNVVYFGSINNGLWKTTDGGKTWKSLRSVPSGTKDRGIRQVLFDSSSSKDGMTRVIYVIVDGEGVFRSTDGGATWKNVGLNVDRPNFYDAEISADGTLYVCGVDESGRTIAVQRFRQERWERIFNATGHAIGEIALDPLNENRAVLLTHGFNQTFITQNLHSDQPTWKPLGHERRADHVPWLAWTEGNWFSLGEVAFDPQIPDRLWIAEGTGVWRTSSIGPNTLVWEEVTVGQEHLVSNDIISLPGGRVITAHWDRPLFLHSDVDQFPKQHQPSRRFNSAWSLDRNPEDPDFVVAIIEDHRYCCYDEAHRDSGFSTDGGETWQRFESFPTFRGKDSVHGQIAVSAGTRENLVWLPVWNSMPYVTKDGGKTWASRELPGNSGNCCIAAPWFQRECLAADRVAAGRFYIYDWAGGHLFQTNDGGDSWKRFDEVLPKWSYHGKLRSVRGREGHLWFAPGQQESVAAIGGLLRTTDGGQTWRQLANTNEVLNLALGKEAPNSHVPDNLHSRTCRGRVRLLSFHR